MNIMNSSKI